MKKKQHEFILLIAGVLLVTVIALRMVYSSYDRVEPKGVSVESLLASETNKTNNEKEGSHLKKKNIQKLKMFCVCESDGCNKCEAIGSAAANLNASREDVNIQFTKVDMQDRASRDFVSQMQVKGQSLIMIKGWRKKRVNLNDLGNGDRLVRKVERAVDSIQTSL
ncbi:hypothetical protein K5X82_16280 [Halosquirtibacter xylanolyticus]|uniref:hypothetical protein n=1 Tax=Halosquirtibacter xylanolyticus TaxID=3374599 RepID=UPI00374951C9|nr:hypothetical protein K5X82_16280 [Prolixibacteraceae bacterium]